MKASDIMSGVFFCIQCSIPRSKQYFSVSPSISVYCISSLLDGSIYVPNGIWNNPNASRNPDRLPALFFIYLNPSAIILRPSSASSEIDIVWVLFGNFRLTTLIPWLTRHRLYSSICHILFFYEWYRVCCNPSNT